MYERSAIVLERFFANLLGLNEVNNLKKNFNNYCRLFEKFKVVQKANSEEVEALKEFQDAENEIEEIQNHEEKLYKKNAKLEYNRDLIFQDITQNPEEIEKCGLKLEGDISKNQDRLVSLRTEFVEAVRSYNAKKSVLSKCKKYRKSIESEYNAILEETQKVIESIPQEYIEAAKTLADSEILQDIVNTLVENGKDEKIPFNNQVITSAAQIGLDITIKEIGCYLEAYSLTKKLINELLDGAVSIELHEKAIRNISVELNFLVAEKEYIIGFLDYERITVIYGKRMHRSLMLDACEKLQKDMVQIENLYQLLLKEIAEKSTKKAYKELYNKSYLVEMEDKDAKFKKEKNRVNLSTATIMNSNYWRIEGIKNIYTVFYKNVVEVFGKNLDEFEVPIEQEEIMYEDVEAMETVQKTDVEQSEGETSEYSSLSSKIDNVFNEIDSLDNVEVDSLKKTLKLIKKAKKRGRKKVKHYTRQIVQFKETVEEPIQESKVSKLKEDDEVDIFGEKYKDIDSKIAELEELEEYKFAKATRYEDEVYDDSDEESIFENMEEDYDKFDLATIDLEKDIKENKAKSNAKNKIFDSFKKLNSKSKKKLANE